MKAALAWIVVLAVLGAGGTVAYRRYREHQDQPPSYTTTAADRAAVLAKVTATGTLSALVTVQVGAQVSGRIVKLGADFNSPVTKNMVLAKLDPELFDANVEQAKANLATAKGSLSQATVKSRDAESTVRRDKQLAAEKLVAIATMETDEANFAEDQAAIEVAQGSVDQAVANLHQAQINLAYTTITSPITGVVISRSVDVGQTVASSLSAPTLFTIAEDLKKMQVDTNVAESDVGRLEPEQEATFTVDAFPGRKFKGIIRQIRNSASTVQNVVTYDAVIDVDNSDLKLRPGMTANVTFIYANVEDALRVPNAALRYRPPDAPEHGHGHWGHGDGGSEAWAGREGGSGHEGGGTHEGGSDHEGGHEHGKDPNRHTVWVLRDAHPSPVRVEVGLTDGSFTEIRSSSSKEGELKEGDLVITDGPLTEGSTSSPRGAGGGGMGGMRRMF